MIDLNRISGSKSTSSLLSFLVSFFGVCVLNALQEGCGSLLGLVLNRFWKLLEGFGEGLGGPN